MSLEEAKELFNIVDLSDDIDLKRIYKNLVFLFHPDAHPENPQEYTEKIKLINEAYGILEHNISILMNNNIKSEKEEYETNKKIRKEQILTGIVIKSYYQSQNEISQLKAEMLNQYINRVSSLDINREKMMGSILEPITIEFAHKEAKIMGKFVNQNVSAFIEEYGLYVDKTLNRNGFLYMFEPLYFLDVIPDWYEKVSTKDNLPRIAKK